MSYDTINTVLGNIIEGQGYSRSQSTRIEDLSNGEEEYSFILKPLSGDNGDESETLADRIYDEEVWSCEIVFRCGTQSDILQLDELNRARETLIKEIDDPASWQGNGIRVVKYDSWELEELPNYYILRIRIKVVDRITY